MTLWVQIMITLAGGVAPFGDPGITDRSHLPRAFRSVPRPSSPLSAKASTRCPCFALDHRIAVTGDAAPPPRTGPSPNRGASLLAPHATVSHEDTSLGQAARHALPAQGLSASVTSQLSLHPSINVPPRSPAALSRNLLRTSPRHPAVLPVAPPGATAWLWPEPGFAGGGGERIRTDDLLLAKQALSQLSYTPAPGIRRQQAGIKTSDP